jgi:hypothetical protein
LEKLISLVEKSKVISISLRATSFSDAQLRLTGKKDVSPPTPYVTVLKRRKTVRERERERLRESV